MKPQILLIFAFVLISVLSFGVMAVGTYPSVDPNMVLYYRFNNDSSVGENYLNNGSNYLIYDYSNVKNNGTARNQSIFSINSSILNDGSMNFTGISSNNSFISVSNHVSLNITNLNFTICSYVKTVGVGATQYIVNRNLNTLFNNAQYLFYLDNFGRVQIAYGNGSASVQYYGTDQTLSLNKWYWICANSTNVFINGILQNTSKLGGIIGNANPSASNLYIGSTTAQNGVFNGSIDDLIIWNRTLSNSELQNIYINYYSCFNLSEGLQIGFTIPICRDTYYLNLGNTYNVNLIRDNFILDLNGSTIISNSSSYPFYLNLRNNITIKNGIIKGSYVSIWSTNSNNISINNISFKDSNNSAIYFSNVSSSLITNNNGYNLSVFMTFLGSNFQNVSNNVLTNSFNGIYSLGGSYHNYNNNSFNNIYLNYCIDFLNSSYINVTNNIFNITDTGIGLIYSVNNTLIQNNSFYNCIGGYDGYTSCINLRGGNVQNNIIQNNTFGIATNQIYIGQSSNNNNNIIRWNIFNTGNINDRLNAFNLGYTGCTGCVNNNDGFEPYCSIVMTEVIRTYTCTNYASCSLLTSNNISIYNNTYDSNTQCFIRNQGVTNLSIDESWYNTKDFWFNSWNLNQFTDKDQLYLSNNFNIIRNINKSTSPGVGSSISSILGQGSRILNWDNINIVTWYTISKDYDYYKNSGSGNILNFTGYSFYNLSSPLLAFSNSSSIYQSGTNLEFNLTLKPNEWVYVFEDFNRQTSLPLLQTLFNQSYIDGIYSQLGYYDPVVDSTCVDSLNAFLSYVGFIGLIGTIVFLALVLAYWTGILNKDQLKNISIISAITTLILIGILLIVAIFLISSICAIF